MTPSTRAEQVFVAGPATLTASGPVGHLTFGEVGTTDRRATVEEAGSALDRAFGEGGLASVAWTSAAGDMAGWRLAWSCGFTFEGTSRASLAVDGQAYDAWHATLLSDDTREPKTTWFEPVTIEHVGVVLRDVKDEDEDRFIETLHDPESQRWLGNIPLPSTAEAFRKAMRARLLNASLGKSINWTVAHPDTDAYLASVTIFELDGLDYKSGEVGYRTHPDARGRGVLTSALRAVITHAFTPLDEGGLGLERVQLLAGDGNMASQGVARSCGFTEVGRDRRSYDLYDGTIVDLVRFDLLRSEFEAS
jgi:ribosomal-protein-alanine N-acetyltransferase